MKPTRKQAKKILAHANFWRNGALEQVLDQLGFKKPVKEVDPDEEYYMLVKKGICTWCKKRPGKDTVDNRGCEGFYCPKCLEIVNDIEEGMH